MRFRLATLLLWGIVNCFGAPNKELCPIRVATLAPGVGMLDVLISAERVEIRQCVVDAAKGWGTFQIVAWSEGATRPGLIVDTEERGLRQAAFIPGVYVFHLVGGAASRVMVIGFPKGMPRMLLDVTTRVRAVIRSNGSQIVIDVYSPDEKHRRFAFRKTGIRAGAGTRDEGSVGPFR